VAFSGPYTQAQAVDLFGAADLLLHTKYNDPCPRLVVEAMACGLPVVYSASGGVPELVGEEAGIGVPAPRDWERDHPPAPEALADAVRRVMQRRPAFSSAARERAVERFDVRPWLKRHATVFAELLPPPAQGGAGAVPPA
jgi:glycosyltransferase involved in cell wall biosynthesis